MQSGGADGESRLTSIPIDNTEPCDGGGTRRIFGDVSPSGTGTVNVAYTNCRIDQDTLTGQASMRIDNVLSFGGDLIPIDYTISFDRLALRGSSNIDIGGSVRVVVETFSNMETITENVVALYNSTGRITKSENMVSVVRYDSLAAPTMHTETMTGRLFDTVHGFVDIGTITPLLFSTEAQQFPNGGMLQLAASGRRIHATALSSDMVIIALDLDNDGAFETRALLGWTQLAGPLGADLADGDSDRMHDSWESAHGVNDPAADNDGDGFSNLSEYLGGGNPTDAATVPRLLAGRFTVASDVATANSDTAVPGPSAVATDGTNYLVVSCRQTGSSTGVFGVLTGPDGQVLNDFLIVNDACPRHVAAAFDGANYLVVRTANGGDVRGMRVTRAGVPQDGAGFLISSPAAGTFNFRPAVAFGGSNYLVLWVNSFAGGRIFGAIVAPNGTVVRAASAITANTVDAFETDPVVAFDGTNYFVVWTRGSQGSLENVFGARVSTAGTVLDTPEIAIATLPDRQRATGVAYDGTNYLVVWDHATNVNISPPPDGQVFGRMVTSGGALVGGALATDAGIPISTGAFQNHSSSVTFAGSSYLVTWAVSSFPNFPPAGIYAARVSRTGVRVDGLPGEIGVPISGSPPNASRFVHPVAASKGESALIAWVNNIEVSGASKDVLAASIFGP